MKRSMEAAGSFCAGGERWVDRRARVWERQVPAGREKLLKMFLKVIIQFLYI